MKICFLSMTNLFLCPYIKKYLSVIDENVNIDLIYWNRHGIKEEINRFKTIYKFDLPMNENISNIKKLYYFIKYRHYCIQVIKRNKYDKIIFLHNYMAILLESYLNKYYKNRYIIDIRDYSFEGNKLFYFLENKAIKNSGLAVISSEGYKKFLPSYKYILCHNDPQIEELKEQVQLAQIPTKPNQSIQISFIGLVRFFEQNKKLIDIFGHDKRFRLAYYGQNAEILQEYAIKHNIEGVIFKGRFKPEETSKYFKITNIINNYYGNNSLSLLYALSNKLYYAAIFRKPILVCENTYMAEISQKYGFGLLMDDTDEFCADNLYKKYQSINWEKLNNGCEAFLDKVKKDNKIFEDSIKAFMRKV